MVLVEMGTTIMGWEIKLNGVEGGEIFMFLPFFRLFLRRKEKPGEGIIRTHARTAFFFGPAFEEEVWTA